MTRTTCKSGLNGWKASIQENYLNFEEFEHYSEMFGLHQRLGFKTAKDAWIANPIVEGSTDISDFRISA